MNDNHKEKRFIKRPEYPGGKTALMQFIKEHLQYPKDALEQKVEGTVRVWYEVNDNGEVEDAKIVRPLFPSCDKEALRLVKSLQYSRPKNMNLRVKSAFHINIRFQLKEVAQQLTFSYVPTQDKKPEKPKSQQNTYTYTINF